MGIDGTRCSLLSCLLRQLRDRQNATPVLLLSARGEVNERVEGLNAGADDYLPKPFVIAELIARVRALGRRGSESKPPILRVADLTLDTVTREARRSGAAIELTMANTAEVAIANTGSGIPAEILPRVFDPFFRGDPSHSHAVDGCGLGLSIARWIATAHGGSIQISSEPSRLTIATVRLPI